jgi:uncharacterized membrane protein
MQLAVIAGKLREAALSPLALDMALALQVPRFGHFYVYPDYIDGWAALLDPPGWSPERAEQLKAIFALRPDPF